MRNTKSIFLFLLVAVFSVSCKTVINNDPKSLYLELGKSEPANLLSKNEMKNGWQLLFDGKSTSGWHGYNMGIFPDCWVIEEGSFTMTTEGRGESQDIITDKIYKNFAFTAEFKLTQGANSGIIFQISEDTTYKYPYETGPEFQIIDHMNWPDPLEDWQKCAANYAMYPSKVTDYKPIGEWNRLLLVVNGNHVTHILNGEIAVEYDKYSEEWTKLRGSGKWASFPDWGKFDEGPISLQNHGTKVWFRNIKIKEL